MHAVQNVEFDDRAWWKACRHELLTFFFVSQRFHCHSSRMRDTQFIPL